MSVFACREIPTNWLACPMTPVLTIVGGETSENHDNYDDMEDGYDFTQYHNIPSVFTKVSYADNAADLISKYAAAIPGEVIWLRNGTYTLTSQLTLNKINTVEDPIYILAENIGGAFFDVSSTGLNGSGYAIKATGVGHVLGGMRFGLTAEVEVIGLHGSYFRNTAIEFDGWTDHCIYTLANINGNVGHEVDNCWMNSKGSGVSQQGYFYDQGPAGPALTNSFKHVRVHHNTFTQMTGGGNEAIQIGSGTHYIDPADDAEQTLQSAYAVIENNFFDRIRSGDPEMVSLKVPSVVVRNNRIDDCSGAIVVRTSHKCHIYANWINDSAPTCSRGGLDSAWLFNFMRNSPSDDASVQFPGTTNATPNGYWQYAPSDRCWIRNNVISNNDILLHYWQAATGSLVRNCSNMIVTNNAVNSAACPQTDATSYKSASWSFANFTTQNTYESNTFSTSTIASTAAKTKALFDGPGDTIDMTVANAPDVWGAPTETNAPSWWKQ